MYHESTSKAEYFDQYDDYFKDQINISCMIFDDRGKKVEIGAENRQLPV